MALRLTSALGRLASRSALLASTPKCLPSSAAFSSYPSAFASSSPSSTLSLGDKPLGPRTQDSRPFFQPKPSFNSRFRKVEFYHGDGLFRLSSALDRRGKGCCFLSIAEGGVRSMQMSVYLSLEELGDLLAFAHFSQATMLTFRHRGFRPEEGTADSKTLKIQRLSPAGNGYQVELTDKFASRAVFQLTDGNFLLLIEFIKSQLPKLFPSSFPTPFRRYSRDPSYSVNEDVNEGASENLHENIHEGASESADVDYDMDENEKNGRQ